MIVKLKSIFLTFLFFSLITFCFCSESDFSASEFLYLSLVASGCDEVDVGFYEAKIETAADEFLIQSDDFVSLEETAENALTFLYQNFLKSYSQNQTRLDTLIDTGKYNCVSSSVLFMYMMKRCGIECVGNETLDHAFCTVIVGDRKIDVETTNPYGFEPGKKKQVSDDRYYKVPAKKYSNRKEINDRRLIALIYDNRIAELQKNRKSLEAIPLAIAAAEIQLHSLQSVDLINKTAANVIAEYSYKQDYDNAILFARDFLSENETSKEIQQNISAVVSKKVELYSNKKDFENGMEFLVAQKDILSEKDFLEYEYVLIVNSLNYAVKTESFESSSEKIKSQRERLSKKNFSELISACYSKETDRIAKEAGYYEAYLFASDAAVEFPSEQNITRLLTNTKQNYAIEIHNKVVPFVNSGKYDEAREIIEDAISKIGSVKLLENDLKKLN